MPEIEFSVVIPVFNSEKTLVELLRRTKKVFEKINNTYEIIFIEDSSNDNSWQVLLSLKKENPNIVKIIKLAKNFGQHNAILCGLNFISGKNVITIDDDLQIPPEEIEKLVNQFVKSSADVVYGNYSSKKHGYYRNLGSFIVQRIFKKIFKTQDNITSFRLISENIVNQIKNHKENFVYIDGLLHWYTKDFAFVNVDHEPRKHGKSGYSLVKLITLANNLLFNFTTLPLRWMIHLGFIFAIFSFIAAFVFIYRKLIYDVPMGFTSIIVTLFFIFSILLLVIGVVGEYISRLYSLQNEKPQYSIKLIL